MFSEIPGKNGLLQSLNLVALCCALPQDYLSDPPYPAPWGLGCLGMKKRLGAIPLLLADALEVRYTPVQEVYFSDTCTIPYENKQKRVSMTPSANRS